MIEGLASRVDTNTPVILAAHVAVADALLSGSERTAVIGRDPVFLTSTLAQKAFDYVALGHIHRHQDMNPAASPPVVYSGSIDRIDFGEESEPKGCCFVSIDQTGPGKPKSTTFEFLTTPARPFKTIRVAVSNSDDATELIIAELDRPATALKFPLRFIPFEHTEATTIGVIITELFEQRFAALEATNAGVVALERDRVFLTVDIRSNSLIISASEENYQEIVTLSKQLDTIPTKLFDQIRIVRLERLNAADLKEKIDELWQRKAELRRVEERFEDMPVVVVDERSNSLIIASSIEDFDEIERLVEVLESQPLIDDTRLFKLEFADAVVLEEMLTQLFEDIAGRSESFTAPTIMATKKRRAIMAVRSVDPSLVLGSATKESRTNPTVFGTK